MFRWLIFSGFVSGCNASGILCDQFHNGWPIVVFCRDDEPLIPTLQQSQSADITSQEQPGFYRRYRRIRALTISREQQAHTGVGRAELRSVRMEISTGDQIATAIVVEITGQNASHC